MLNSNKLFIKVSKVLNPNKLYKVVGKQFYPRSG